MILSAREAAPMADAIMHIRVTSDTGPVLFSSRPECAGSPLQTYAVEALNAVVRRRQAINARPCRFSCRYRTFVLRLAGNTWPSSGRGGSRRTSWSFRSWRAESPRWPNSR